MIGLPEWWIKQRSDSFITVSVSARGGMSSKSQRRKNMAAVVNVSSHENECLKVGLLQIAAESLLRTTAFVTEDP